MPLFIRLVLLCWLLSSIASAETIPTPLTFASAEHVWLGDEVSLPFVPMDNTTHTQRLSLPNGLRLSYGQLVSLGDFYGIVQHPISSASSPKNQRKRFITAFNQFALNESLRTETVRILKLIDYEMRVVLEGMQNDESEEAVYAQLGLKLDKEFNCITGGGCGETTWWLKSGRYLQLMIDNFDHFGDDALHSYQVGHQLAIDTALKAARTQDINQLQLAYAINAFASHFLSDRYSAGHMRAPRRELPGQVSPGIVGNILVNFMHNEENKYGLHVHNARGETWVAYGDKFYLSPDAREHRAHLLETMQVSVDAIATAYQTGQQPVANTVEMRLPYPDESPLSPGTQADIAPLFYWNAKTNRLMRRSDVLNPYDYHWTSDWWGWTTLLALQGGHKPLPVAQQAALAQSELGEQSIQAGLISDTNVLMHQDACSGKRIKCSR